MSGSKRASSIASLNVNKTDVVDGEIVDPLAGTTDTSSGGVVSLAEPVMKLKLVSDARC